MGKCFSVDKGLTEPKKIQCPKCKGIGLIKTEFKYCSNCDGKKCFRCNGKGYSQSNWSECNVCYGSGELISTNI